MKRFRDIIQDIKAPSTSDLWINNGELKYYTSNGRKAIAGNGSSDVYVLPGNLQTTEGWSTTDVESIVGNWDEFTKAVLGRKAIITNIYSYDTVFTGTSLINQSIEGYFLFIMAHDKYFVYLISEDVVILLGSDTVLFASYIEDNLNSLETKLPLSANQGRILNDRVTELESKSNVAVLTPTGTKLMELVSSSPNVTQEQLVEAGFTPEICRRLNAGEVIYMSGECAGFGNDALYPIQGIAPNSSPDLVPSRLCYCHYSSYNADGTANGGCFTTIKKQSSGQYLVDYIEV
jgi:hypothetical protein